MFFQNFREDYEALHFHDLLRMEAVLSADHLQVSLCQSNFKFHRFGLATGLFMITKDFDFFSFCSRVQCLLGMQFFSLLIHRKGGIFFVGVRVSFSVPYRRKDFIWVV